MKLCIDTCTNVCSVGVVEENKIIAERLYNDKLRHSEILMVEIDDMIKKLERTPNDIDEIYVSNGPGSFTGIRIGVTTANTLADTLDVKIISYSVLDVVASNVLKENEIVCALFDARNDRYYAAVYTKTAGKMELLLERQVMNIQDLKDYLVSNFDKVIFVGDINIKHRDELSQIGEFSLEALNLPRACMMPFIDDELRSTDLIDGKFIKPSYLEKSQAERMEELKKNV